VKSTLVNDSDIEHVVHHAGIHLLSVEGEEIRVILGLVGASEIKFAGIDPAHDRLVCNDIFLVRILIHYLIEESVQIEDPSTLFCDAQSLQSSG